MVNVSLALLVKRVVASTFVGLLVHGVYRALGAAPGTSRTFTLPGALLPDRTYPQGPAYSRRQLPSGRKIQNLDRVHRSRTGIASLLLVRSRGGGMLQ